MNEKDLYAKIAEELGTDNMDPAVWTQAFAEADGDHDKAKAIYIRLRRAELTRPDLTLGPGPTASAKAEPDPMQHLRGELARALESSGRGSLYRTLKLSPTCSDADVAKAIAAIRAEEVGPNAEVRYAIEVLGESEARKDYDRKLAAQLGCAPGPARPTGDAMEYEHPLEEQNVFMQWWATRKVTVLVGAASIALLGYMINAFYQTKTISDRTLDAVTLQETQLERNAELAKQREERLQRYADQRERRAQEAAARNARREEERRIQRAQNEIRRQQRAYATQKQRAERAKTQQSYAELNRKRQEQREAEQARRRAARETAYWSCFNDAMDRGDSAYANRKCASLRP